VVGDAGAGKSSVINAMLDGGLRAPMTHQPSHRLEPWWNNSTNPLSRYQTEIEFISQAVRGDSWKSSVINDV
jgi:GTPase SAR1 family protein